MKKQQTRLVLNKKTVSVLQAKQMYAVRGGADIANAGNANAVNISALGGITKPNSDSFVACGSCFGDCATNSTACGVEMNGGNNNAPFVPFGGPNTAVAVGRI